MLKPALASANEAKASFDDIYVKSDPRDYFSVLGSLDYAIPDLANPIIRQTLAHWRDETGRSPTVLDVGSSYGVNAALLRYPLSFDMLRRRYTQREVMALPSEDVLALDRRYFQAWPRIAAHRFVVLDASQPAIDYALSVGLADAGLAADFEAAAPNDEARRALADVDVVITTGAVGYVGVKTFDAILSAARRPPWVISFVLRMFDYKPIARRLGAAGLATEKLGSAAFVQRRFRDAEEAQGVLDVIRQRGLDPTGLEAEGMLFAELFVSRPPEAIETMPLEEMVTVASGRNLNLGPRLMHLRRSGCSEIVAAR
jgi:hypothetical protein